jgi:chloramphenicol-sensitive protein RarD
MSSVMSTRPGPSDEQRGIVAGLAAYTLWGLLTLFWRLLHDFDAFELIGWRVLSSAAVMAVVLSLTGRWGAVVGVLRQRRLLVRVTVAALLLSVNWLAYVSAVVDGNVIETALGYFIAPLGTMALGVLVLRERLHTPHKVAIVLAVAAVIVLTWSYGRVPWLALAIAVTWTTYGYMKKFVPLTPVESMGAETMVLAVPALALVLALSVDAGSVSSSASSGEVALVAATGLATVVPLTLFAVAAQRVRLTILGPMQYLVPVLNFLFGWLLFDEDLPPSRIAGFALVWMALAVLTVDSVHRARRGRARRAAGGEVDPATVGTPDVDWRPTR